MNTITGWLLVFSSLNNVQGISEEPRATAIYPTETACQQAIQLVMAQTVPKYKLSCLRTTVTVTIKHNHKKSAEENT